MTSGRVGRGRSDLCRVNFEVNDPKPFPHLAFAHSKEPKTPSKIPSFDGELMASFSDSARSMSAMASRVENRRSGVSLPVAVGLGFRFARLNPVWPGSVSCSRSSNRTGRFPASGSRKRHTMFRVTPSATAEHNSGWLDSSSIPMSFVASCIRL